jgi:hypothetical protein
VSSVSCQACVIQVEELSGSAWGTGEFGSSAA